MRRHGLHLVGPNEAIPIELEHLIDQPPDVRNYLEHTVMKDPRKEPFRDFFWHLKEGSPDPKQVALQIGRIIGNQIEEDPRFLSLTGTWVLTAKTMPDVLLGIVHVANRPLDNPTRLLGDLVAATNQDLQEKKWQYYLQSPYEVTDEGQ